MTDQLPIPKVLGWQALYEKGARARCIKDVPPARGFGRQLKVGDIVKVAAVCWRNGYEIAIKEECAFYKLEGYFEPLLPSVVVDPRDPDPSRPGIFRYHNCWKCKDGTLPCAQGNPNQCEYPHARND